MVQALRALIDLIYLAQHNVLDMNSLNELDGALQCFYKYHQIVQESGVRPKGFTLP
jgi:hypothetical protein